ncbi:MAG: putative transposase [Mycobacterium sp.]|nr:putative transposase [Mycobacterium sp.]
MLALAVAAGLQVMQALMDAHVTALAGPKCRHDEARTAVRDGRERGSVTLGGRRVAVTRPRVRAADGSGELSVPSYELFTSTEILGKMAIEKMLAGLTTRWYPVERHRQRRLRLPIGDVAMIGDVRQVEAVDRPPRPGVKRIAAQSHPLCRKDPDRASI